MFSLDLAIPGEAFSDQFGRLWWFHRGYAWNSYIMESAHGEVISCSQSGMGKDSYGCVVHIVSSFMRSECSTYTTTTGKTVELLPFAMTGFLISYWRSTDILSTEVFNQSGLGSSGTVLCSNR